MNKTNLTQPKKPQPNTPMKNKMITPEVINASKDFIETRKRLERAYEKMNKASTTVHYISTYLEDGESTVQEFEFWKSVSDEATSEYKSAVNARNESIKNFKETTHHLFLCRSVCDIDLMEQALEIIRNA